VPELEGIADGEEQDWPDQTESTDSGSDLSCNDPILGKEDGDATEVDSDEDMSEEHARGQGKRAAVNIYRL
jgi:hypothetical protein